MTKSVTLTELRDNLGNLLNEIRSTGEKVIVTKNGKPLATLSAPPITEPSNPGWIS